MSDKEKLISVSHVWMPESDRWINVKTYNTGMIGVSYMQGDEYELFKEKYCEVDKDLSNFYQDMKNELGLYRAKLTEIEFRSYVFDKTKLNKGASGDLGKVEKEDEFVVQNVQKGINSAFYKSGRYSATKEKGVHHFHHLISKLLKS